LSHGIDFPGRFFSKGQVRERENRMAKNLDMREVLAEEGR